MTDPLLQDIEQTIIQLKNQDQTPFEAKLLVFLKLVRDRLTAPAVPQPDQPLSDEPNSVIEQIDNLLSKVSGINDERDSVPILLGLRERRPKAKALLTASVPTSEQVEAAKDAWNDARSKLCICTSHTGKGQVYRAGLTWPVVADGDEILFEGDANGAHEFAERFCAEAALRAAFGINGGAARDAVIEGAQMAKTRLDNFADDANAGRCHYDARELKRKIWAAFVDFDRALSTSATAGEGKS